MPSRFLKGLYAGFYKHRLLENAASLSFYTLMSIVPILAVLFGIAKGFGLETLLEHEVLGAVPNNQEALAHQAIAFAKSTLEQSRGGVIAGVGVLLLLWSFMGLIGNFEKALNEIWQIKEGRPYARRLGDFLGFIFLTPFILVAISSTLLFITTGLIDLFNESFGAYLSLLFKCIPIALTFLIYTFFYLYLPNIKVPLKAILIAAFIAALFFHLTQWAFVYFQIGIAKYGAIYGSFAAIPLFLLWLQASWLITLFGAEIAARLTPKPSI